MSGTPPVPSEIIPPKGEKEFQIGEHLPPALVSGRQVMERYLSGKEVLEHVLVLAVIRCRPHLHYWFNETERKFLGDTVSAYIQAGQMRQVILAYRHDKKLLEEARDWKTCSTAVQQQKLPEHENFDGHGC